VVEEVVIYVLFSLMTAGLSLFIQKCMGSDTVDIIKVLKPVYNFKAH
jgi:hypothetical protein